MTSSSPNRLGAGRVASDQALAVPVEPVSRLDPTGFDPSRIASLQGDKYSPNLRKFMRSRRQRAYRTNLYRDTESNWLYIGQLFDDGWFHGAQLNRVLCVGSKAETWAYSPVQLSLTLIDDFWERYERIGRCAIDVAHDRYFIGDGSRWLTDGDTRSCLWCGAHTQRLRRWVQKVERERWEPASGMEAGTAETAEQGSGRRPTARPDAQGSRP
jgi:hypothetical protein